MSLGHIKTVDPKARNVKYNIVKNKITNVTAYKPFYRRLMYDFNNQEFG